MFIIKINIGLVSKRREKQKEIFKIQVYEIILSKLADGFQSIDWVSMS